MPVSATPIAPQELLLKLASIASHSNHVLHEVVERDGVRIQVGTCFGDWGLVAIFDLRILYASLADPPPLIPGGTHIFFFCDVETQSRICFVPNGQDSGPKTYMNAEGIGAFCPGALEPFTRFTEK